MHRCSPRSSPDHTRGSLTASLSAHGRPMRRLRRSPSAARAALALIDAYQAQHDHSRPERTLMTRKPNKGRRRDDQRGRQPRQPLPRLYLR